jgi:hypothetical protein
MAQFQIRAARDDDAVAIAQAHIDAWRDAMPWLPMVHGYEDIVRYFGDFVIPNQVVLVAEAEDGVVAFVAIERAFVEASVCRADASRDRYRRRVAGPCQRTAARGVDALDLRAQPARAKVLRKARFRSNRVHRRLAQ